MTARELVRNAVVTLCRESGGTGPLAAITAARHLEWEAREAVRAHARTAREDGESWTDIGEALGFANDPEPGMTSVAERAFLRVASDLGRGPCFAWTCPQCREMVIDYGPETGNPADTEQGHTEGCARLAETVAAWDAQWGEG